MTNYISIKSALRFIPKPLFQQSTELDFLSWMLDAYRELDLPVTAESKAQIFEIVDGKVELPEEIKIINCVSWQQSNPTEKEKSDYIESIKTIDTVETTTVTIDNTKITTTVSTSETEPNLYPIYYRQFLSSSYFKNNYIPLLYKGNTTNLLCKNCPNQYASCQNVFSIDKNKILRTNLDSGYLCIEYDTEMVDCDGDFLIVDLTEVKRYLAYYAEAQHWRERAAVKEQSASNMAQEALTKAEIYFKKVRGILLLSGINPQNISSAQYDNYQHYLKLPEKYVYSR